MKLARDPKFTKNRGTSQLEHTEWKEET
jgi:hypothetical protein